MDLAEGELVVLRLIRGGQMRIEALQMDFGTFADKIDQVGNLALHESEAVHAGVDIDVDRIVPPPDFAEFFAQAGQRIEVRDARLQSVTDDFRIVFGSGRQDQDRQVDARFSKFYALAGQRDTQIISPKTFHFLGERDGAVAVAVGFDQDQHFGFGFKK